MASERSERAFLSMIEYDTYEALWAQGLSMLVSGFVCAWTLIWIRYAYSNFKRALDNPVD